MSSTKKMKKKKVEWANKPRAITFTQEQDVFLVKTAIERAISINDIVRSCVRLFMEREKQMEVSGLTRIVAPPPQ